MVRPLRSQRCASSSVHSMRDSLGATRSQAIDYARRALRTADSDPFLLASAALVFGHCGEDIDAAMALMDRALAANPGSAYGWAWSGLLRLYAGEPDPAIEHVERSMRINPRERMVAPLTLIGSAYFFKLSSRPRSRSCKHRYRNVRASAMSYRVLAACYAQMGRLDEAREVVERLRLLTPVIVPPFIAIGKPEHRELFLSGLRLAAGETE